MDHRRRPTILQVARLAGVSTTTVSNVLNNRMDAMRAETRLRVEEAARILGYQPSHAARSLASRQSATLGLVISEIATSLFFSAVSVVEREARDSGFNVLLCHASTPSEERAALDLLAQKEVEGLLFLSTSDYHEDGALRAVAETLPVVTVNRAGDGDAFDRISWDNVDGIASAVRHLHDLGHRRIAFLRGPADRQGTDERFQGYRSGLTACGLDYLPEYVATGDYTAGPEEWWAGAKQVLDVRPAPTAVIASDDSVAAVVIRTVRSRGLQVPDDVAVVGVDDQPFAAWLSPALTTVRLPILDAGQQAISLLLDRLRNPSRDVAHLTLPVTLVVRESCGAGRTETVGR